MRLRKSVVAIVACGAILAGQQSASRQVEWLIRDDGVQQRGALDAETGKERWRFDRERSR